MEISLVGFFLVLGAVGCKAGVYDEGSFPVGNSPTNPKIVVVVFDACFKVKPSRITAKSLGATQWNDRFSTQVTTIELWGFIASVRRTDMNVGWGQTTVTMKWQAYFSTADYLGSSCASPESSCTNTEGGVNCTCPKGYELPDCTNIDDCSPSPCLNNATCVDGVANYSCQCLPGFTGKNCSTDIDDCLASPCAVGSTCIDLVLDFKCICAAGFTGKNCSTKIDHCATDPCFHGNCTNAADSYACSCDPGYAGQNCSILNDPCQTKPCKNGGLCSDYGFSADYICVCLGGFSGKNCSIEIDNCLTGPCQNEATCTNQLNDYVCTCVAGYTGKNCSKEIDNCLSGPCQNGATCTNQLNDYVCNCVAGYTGKNCSKEIDNCLSSPCQNGATCTNQLNDYVCTCVAGYTDKNCSKEIDNCLSGPCQNGATCTNQLNDYVCNCVAGFTGKNCSTDINDCLPDPCKNGATCRDKLNGYTCSCVPGYNGTNCSQNVDDCLSAPCLNNATCRDLVDDFTCSCVAGFTGKTCATDIDDCVPNKCKNFAKCTDEVNDYSCACEIGFTGKNCETNIDDCASTPCLNNATCKDFVNNFTCQCRRGFTGPTCSTDIDECAPKPCQNGGQCVDKINDYTCVCSPGYTGKNCSTNIDDCSPDPCKNGATCTDLVANYQCTCPSGYTDKDCGTNINDCVDGACKNGGRCLDLVNSYRCVCVAGYAGTHCETNVDDCLPNPCSKNANCVDLVNAFNCVCKPGYRGALCQAEVDECLSSPCLHNGTCLDMVNNYYCDCVYGYEGKNCEILPWECRLEGCSPFSRCAMLNNGSYACVCQDHYIGDGFVCKPTCSPKSFWQPRLNSTLTFPTTAVGQTAVSKEICKNGNGRPLASIDCVYVRNSTSRAEFSSLYFPKCTETVESVVRQVDLNSSSENVASTVAFLKLVTHNTSQLTPNLADSVVWGLEQVYSATASNKASISSNVMYDTMQVTDHISEGLTLSNAGNASSPLVHPALKQRTLNVLEVTSFQVKLPANDDTLTLQTKNTTLQIVRPRLGSGGRSRRSAGYNDVSFQPFRQSINSSKPPVDVTIPGSLLDQASAASENSSLHISFFAFNNDALFPSEQHPRNIISAKIKGFSPIRTAGNVKLIFQNESARQGAVPDPNNTLKDSVTRTQCSVWNPRTLQWVPDGCSLELGSHPPRCKCFKLANFAMLVDTKVLPSAFAMGVFSYVGMILSVLCLLATIAIYFFIRDLHKRQPTVFLLNICFNLLAVNLIFMIGSSQVSQLIPCYIIAILLHYFLLVTWFWMAANAFNMYYALVKVIGASEELPRIAKYICYLVPLCIVVVDCGFAIFYKDLATYRPDNIFFESAYKSRHVCWLHYLSLQYGFLLPVGLLSIFNVCLFIVVFSKITCRRTKVRSTSKGRTTKEEFMVAIALIIIMGLTWAFGFLMLVADDVTYKAVMAWLFTIFNSTQGISIFLLNCVRQPSVRRMWCRCWCRKDETEKSRAFATTSSKF